MSYFYLLICIITLSSHTLSHFTLKLLTKKSKLLPLLSQQTKLRCLIVKAELHVEILLCDLGPTTTKLESYENWVISQWPINNCSMVVNISLTVVPHFTVCSLSTTLPSLFLCSFSLILSPSLLDECVLLGRADSSYLAEALWTIKIWFQSPAGCWAWGLGSALVACWEKTLHSP